MRVAKAVIAGLMALTFALIPAVGFAAPGHSGDGGNSGNHSGMGGGGSNGNGGGDGGHGGNGGNGGHGGEGGNGGNGGHGGDGGNGGNHGGGDGGGSHGGGSTAGGSTSSPSVGASGSGPDGATGVLVNGGKAACTKTDRDHLVAVIKLAEMQRPGLAIGDTTVDCGWSFKTFDDTVWRFIQMFMADHGYPAYGVDYRLNPSNFGSR